MSEYPGAIDTFRTVENLPGLEYNADDTKTLFAEDFNALASAIVAIEENAPTPAPSELPVGSIITTTLGDDSTAPYSYGVWTCVATGDFFGGVTSFSWERTE